MDTISLFSIKYELEKTNRKSVWCAYDDGSKLIPVEITKKTAAKKYGEEFIKDFYSYTEEECHNKITTYYFEKYFPSFYQKNIIDNILNFIPVSAVTPSKKGYDNNKDSAEKMASLAKLWTTEITIDMFCKWLFDYGFTFDVVVKPLGEDVFKNDL